MNLPTLSEISVNGLLKIVSGSIALLIAWLCWLTAGVHQVGTAVQDRCTPQSVRQIVQDASPYNADRNLILEHMQDRKKAEERLQHTLDRQTESIRRIETELARFAALLQQQLAGHAPAAP